MKIRDTIRLRLFLIVLIAVLPALGVILWTGVEQRDDAIRSAEQQSLLLTRYFAEQQQEMAVSTEQILRTLANVHQNASHDPVFWRKILRDIKERNPAYRHLLIAAANGRILASSDGNTDAQVAARKYFRDALTTKAFSAGEYVIDKETGGGASIHFAYPQLDGQGAVRCVFVAAVNLDAYWHFMDEVKFPSGYVMNLVDRQGIRLFRYPQPLNPANGVGAPVGEESRRHLRDSRREGFFEATGADGVFRIYTFHKLFTRGEANPYVTVMVGVDRSVIMARAAETFRRNLFLTALAFLCALTATWFIGNIGIVNRIRRIAAAARQLRDGTTSVRMDIPYSEGEVGDLAKSFDEMAAGLEARTAERDRTLDALRQSEQKYRTLFQNAVIGIFQSTPEGRFLSVNPSTASMCGYETPEEMVASITDIATQYYVDPTDRIRYKQEMEANGFVRNFEHRAYRKDGSIFWVSVSARAVQDDRGRVLRYEGTHEDITLRKEAEGELLESEERFSKAFRSNPAPMAISTIDEGRYIDVNDRFADMFGVPREEIIGRTSAEMGFWENPADRQELVRKLRTEGIVRIAPVNRRRKDGEIRHTLWSGETIRLKGREVLLTLHHDVTDRMLAEEKLRQSEERYRGLFENSIVGVFQSTPEGRYLAANPACARMFGYDSPAAMIASVTDIGTQIYCNPEDRRKAMEAFSTSGTLQRFETRCRRKDGTVIWTIINARAVRDAHGRIRFFEGLIEDISERKNAERALRESEERFSKAFRFSPVLQALSTLDEGRIIDVNDRWLEVMGYERDEVIGRTAAELGVWEDPDAREDALSRVAEGETLVDFRVRARTKSGDIRIVNLSGSRIQAAGQDLFFSSAVDITETLNMQNALAESESRMRALLDNIPDMAWLKDRHSRFIAVNEAFSRACGVSQKDLAGKTDFDIWPADLAHRYRADDEEVMQSGERKRSEEPFADREGRIRWVDTIKTPFYNDEGDIIGTAGIARDITERKKVEDLYRTLSEMSVIGVCVIQDGRFRFLSKHAALYAGHAPDEMIGKNALDWVHPDDRDMVRKATIEMVKGRRSSPLEYRIVCKNVSTRWILGAASSIDYEGRQATLLNVADITEMKETRRKLEEARAMAASILSAIPHAVMGLCGSTIFFSSDRAEEVFGWNSSEIVGRDISTLFKDREHCRELFGKLREKFNGNGPSREDVEAPFVRKDGKEITCRVTASGIGQGCPSDEKKIVIVLEDITELRRTQLRVLQSEKMASIGQLAAGVAHEINNPIGYVSSNLKTMSEYLPSLLSILQAYRELLSALGPGCRASMETIAGKAEAVRSLEKSLDIDYILNDAQGLIGESREGTERVKEIVLALKNFAHPGEDKFTYADINKSLESTLQVVWNELKYKATVRKEYGALPEIQCYPQQLNQVFMNILVNAGQAIVDRGEITIRTRAENGSVIVDISDTGTGIAPEHLSRIFEPFFTTKEVGKGTGLGLNVAYNIIRKHRGRIDVRSAVGRGTTFSICLPVTQPDAIATGEIIDSTG